MASKAATEGGMASGEWTSLALRANDDRSRRESVACRVLCFCLIGICTALEDVIGRGLVVAMLIDDGLSPGGGLLSGRDDFPLGDAILVV
jgi:hypothetical protein